ncbi:kinase [Novosphingobium sp. AAP83]|uniref:type II toxin-antitoxin system HipA family toxin n=1 Tax=Novosphingobium sp. AAP83 TaxID=1523425 RepID=UPI0006B94C9B|nr:type II toxin-antitoxin system HipA family toxin [Novosphingobium sp. AAP83]KPF91182.1 kinase [Novosphingobium sp. AAP83]
MTNRLTVWWDGRVTGCLYLGPDGDTQFAYDAAWLADATLPALSFSLPKQAEPFNRRACQPFFGGILPEEGQRTAIARALGVSADNEFRLLEYLGGEVAGALTLLPEGELPTPPSAAAPKLLNDDDLVRLLDHLPMRPMLAGEDGLRLSLAGAQSKLPVLVIDGQIALPAPGQPTSHILKPPIARFAGTTENEYFCMSLARAVGLDVAPVEMRTVQGRSFLLITRYDRAIGPEGEVARLHQEDFAQALGVPSHRKYASEGGPNFPDCFALLRRAATRPPRDILRLLDAAIFNLIIGNADAHAKNFSLLHKQGAITLAPLYDLLSTVLYPELSPKLAMKIGGKAVLDDIEARHWDRFAADAQLGAPFVRARVRQLGDAVLTAIDSKFSEKFPILVGVKSVCNVVRERTLTLQGKA